ncbi:MAG: phosphoribosylformylglycinamidine synthase subunit PurL [Pyrinomonadaceae bacterium]
MNLAHITPEVVAAHHLTAEEFARIEELLGRAPSFAELGIFSVMWSEHCSYKSSRVHLKKLPTTGARVIVPPGENAGVIDVGDGWCAAFKVESHNHPSFIEPFQGAATGVGGILRDIFTMGARPVAAMNSIRFGSLDDKQNGRRNQRLLAGVVAGIAHYGNAFGVATVGGEAMFDDAYALNPLVNAFALGLVRRDAIFFGTATGVGNPILYVGAKTGRDGIHGATMSSAEFDDEALEKRPTVQVGDPFLEKLLLEACLEAMRSGAIAGIQDMGAAGLTSSSCEMAARAGNGIEIDLTLVPQREQNMTAYEMLLSESQERMLIVAHKGQERQVVDIFRKWDLDAVVIGRVTEGGHMRVRHNDELVADIPVRALTDEAPKYERLMRAPVSNRSQESGISSQKSEENHHVGSRLKTDGSELRSTENYANSLRRLLASPNIASKEWVYRQYDHMVRTNTAVLPGADAAVVRIKETRRALAMCLDGNGRFCAVNPREGAKLIVAEAARNVVCVGARPLAITNCLNFASPERPEVMWSFGETIEGIGEACRALETPVVSGNVSFYNETDGRGILPTPVIGMVGLVEDVRRIIQHGFKTSGDLIAMLGTTNADLSVSEYAAIIEGRTIDEMIEMGADVPVLDLSREKGVQQACLRATEAGLLRSAHDCSDGGLAVAISECCFSSLNRGSIGADIELRGESHGELHSEMHTEIHGEQSGALSITAHLFSESPSRIVVSFGADALEAVKEIALQENCPLTILGRTGADYLRIITNGEEVLRASVDELETAWRTSLASKLQREVLAAEAE